MAYIFYAFPPVTVSCFSEGFDKSSCLHRASIVSKTLFIVPTDTHYYKNHRMLKQFKILTLAPTCFGSSRNDHQGAVLCLAKITKYGFSVLVGIDVVVRFTVEAGTASTVNRTPAQQADMPP